MTTATASRNGSAAETTFPLDGFREAARELRRPFTTAAVKFKPQSVTKSGKTLCVAYIDARLVVERLNLILPHCWHDEYEPLGAKHLICRLTVDGITRQDIGEGTGKALYSDALKRAAVKFGIGVSLYAVPSMLLPGKVEYLYPDSAEYRNLRAHYTRWLDQHGRQAFGEPLDHGDVEDAQGDHEADRPASEEPTAPEAVEPSTGEVIDSEEAEFRSALVTACRDILDAGIWTKQGLQTHLVAAGAADTSSVKAAVASMAREQADELHAAMCDLLAERDGQADDAAEQMAMGGDEQ